MTRALLQSEVCWHTLHYPTWATKTPTRLQSVLLPIHPVALAEAAQPAALLAPR